MRCGRRARVLRRQREAAADPLPALVGAPALAGEGDDDFSGAADLGLYAGTRLGQDD